MTAVRIVVVVNSILVDFIVYSFDFRPQMPFHSFGRNTLDAVAA
jgi:hypothetical protein